MTEDTAKERARQQDVDPPVEQEVATGDVGPPIDKRPPRATGLEGPPIERPDVGNTEVPGLKDAFTYLASFQCQHGEPDCFAAKPAKGAGGAVCNSCWVRSWAEEMLAVVAKMEEAQMAVEQDGGGQAPGEDRLEQIEQVLTEISGEEPLEAFLVLVSKIMDLQRQIRQIMPKLRNHEHLVSGKAVFDGLRRSVGTPTPAEPITRRQAVFVLGQMLSEQKDRQTDEKAQATCEQEAAPHLTGKL